MAYSQNYVINPQIAYSTAVPLASFNTSSCSADRSVTRYYNTSKALWNLGIAWCPCSELIFKDNQKPSIAIGDTSYNGQLPRGSGASTWLDVKRTVGGVVAADKKPAQLCTVEISYYVTYKGTTASTSLQVKDGQSPFF